ncbi:hypothetical protein HK103_000563 [Boothiomyces macroporosus]|uniref:Uncharacterized protein n=1 Tax=Boothiomyces macroporosus TaxID=261099 RepID=A0AAD5UNT9_9FUNG|nr:hypothetical protein HK103_000563 [Boothiomyces macroporosus]
MPTLKNSSFHQRKNSNSLRIKKPTHIERQPNSSSSWDDSKKSLAYQHITDNEIKNTPDAEGETYTGRDWIFEEYGLEDLAKLSIPPRRHSDPSTKSASAKELTASLSYSPPEKLNSSDSGVSVGGIPDLFAAMLDELQLPDTPNVNTQKEVRLPDHEGELYFSNTPDSVGKKRWCSITRNRFTVYRSFKDRSIIISIKLDHTCKIFPKEPKSVNQKSFGFKLSYYPSIQDLKPTMLDFNSDSMVVILRWVNKLTKSCLTNENFSNITFIDSNLSIPKRGQSLKPLPKKIHNFGFRSLK